jgi:hypothetical protein
MDGITAFSNELNRNDIWGKYDMPLFLLFSAPLHLRVRRFYPAPSFSGRPRQRMSFYPVHPVHPCKNAHAFDGTMVTLHAP